MSCDMVVTRCVDVLWYGDDMAFGCLVTWWLHSVWMSGDMVVTRCVGVWWYVGDTACGCLVIFWWHGVWMSDYSRIAWWHVCVCARTHKHARTHAHTPPPPQTEKHTRVRLKRQWLPYQNTSFWTRRDKKGKHEASRCLMNYNSSQINLTHQSFIC